jgi:hypothetical protein
VKAIISAGADIYEAGEGGAAAGTVASACRVRATLSSSAKFRTQ